jgi:hypothetical protein
LLPYAAAYVVWLAIGLACLMTSAVLIAPGWGGRFYALVWNRSLSAVSAGVPGPG